MAFSWQESAGTAGQKTVAVNIAYLSQADIHVEVNDVEVSGFTWDSSTLIRLPVSTVIAEGDKIAVIRRTNKDHLRLLFAEGAAFTRDNLDEQNTQFLYLAQELVEGRSIDGFYGDIDMNGFRIEQLGDPQNAGDAVNRRYVDAATAKNIRVPETSVAVLPKAEDRANRIFGWDAQGQPAMVLPESGSAADVLLQLAAPTGYQLVGGAVGAPVLGASGGAGMVGYKSGTVQSALDTMGASVSNLIQTRAYTTPEQFGAKRDGVTDDSAAIQAAIDSLPLGGTVFFSGGVYAVGSTLNLANKKCHLFGAGHNQTKLQAIATMGVMVDNWQDTVDWGFNEFSMTGIQFDGNSKANVTFRVKNRNYCRFVGCAFFGGVQYSVQAESNISNQWNMCAFGNSAVLLSLLGSNHRNAFIGCTFVGATNTFVQIVDGFDGNSAIVFDNCDIEYQNGTATVTGVYARVAGSVSFNDCYMGEGIRGTSLFLEGTGSLNVRGGLMVFGEYTGSMTRVTGNGEILFTDVDLNGGTNASIALLGDGFGTRIGFTKCRFNFPALGVQLIWVGGIARGGSANNPVTTYGKGWTLDPSNGTATQSVSGTGRAVAVTSPSSSGLMFLTSPLDQSKLSSGLGTSGRYSRVLVTYNANTVANVYTVNASGGAVVNTLGALPVTGGNVATAVIAADISGGSLMEIAFSTGVGAQFTLLDVTVLDAAYCTTPSGTVHTLMRN